MVKYNTLKIEGDKLIVEIEIEDKSYYSNSSISGVRLDTSLTYGNKDHPYDAEVLSENVRKCSVEFFIPDVKGELLVITPIVELNLPPDYPCGADIVDTAAVYNKDILLDKGLEYMKELGDTCELSKNFIDFILKSYALDMLIDTCNYSTAFKYWKMLTGVNGITLKGCKCNGS